MKIVGLLSGGKDSCYNLCHCVGQGHEVVVLASLGPEGGKEEIDSYMYQTVGQDGLHLIAEALDLPLIRGTISGKAVDQGSDYAATAASRAKGLVEGDETEDLFRLLEHVKTEYPDVQGVSVGAILSNYQRIRVEHVCARLGLQAFAYLWQYRREGFHPDQAHLLEDMHDAGMKSVIIKVAGAGLGVRHLGQDVCCSEMRETLSMLNEKWGTHPAGEGGEYETFTVDCPLFKKRIELVETEPVVLSSGDSRDDIGTVAYLRLKRANLVEKNNPIFQTSSDWVPTENSYYSTPYVSEKAEKMFKALPLPDTLDIVGWKLHEPLPNGGEGYYLPADEDKDVVARASSNEVCLVQHGSWISVGNIKCPANELEEEVRACFRILQAKLAKIGADLTSVVHINLYIASMSLFAPINAIYNTFFGPSPPTRACVSAVLPQGQHMLMDIIAYASPTTDTTLSQRTALHVRSISHWAPANIGPYSQSVNVGGRLFIAGQIGLRPPTLQLDLPRDFSFECALSIQHVRRIVLAVQEGTGGGFKGHMESCVCWLSGPKATFERKRDHVRATWSAWMGKQAAVVPMLMVQVPQLPKDAMVEWQVTWHTGRGPADNTDDGDSDDGDDSQSDLKPIYQQRLSDGVHYQRLGTGRSSFAIFASDEGATNDNDGPSDPGLSIRGFYTSDSNQLQSLVKAYGGPNAQSTAVQVLNLATLRLDTAKAALCALG